VPAYFNDNQRQATKNAGTIAGLRVAHILNEPTAAAIGYGLNGEHNRTLAVFDLGGGTFDVTILRKDGDVFEVLATNGDTFLGGDDFDARIIAAVVDDCAQRFEVDLTQDASAMQRLKEAAERAKRELSSAETTRMNLPFLTRGPDGPVHIDYEAFSRRDLERATSDLIARLEAPCRTALQDARIKPAHIDEVLLVGGMSRMPAVQRKVAEIFGANKVRRDADPEKIVALGAAIQCGILSGSIEGVSLLDVTPHSLGVRVLDGRMSVVVPKNSAIPTTELKVFATTKDFQKAVTIEVFQGEDTLVANNVMLGAFELGPLPPAVAGQVQVEVTFTTDADGVLSVSALEASSRRAACVKIAASGGLNTDQIEQIRCAQAARHSPSLSVRES
jgi:molecular chaperone DnaK